MASEHTTELSELRLIARAKHGGPRERDELVRAFRPMIASVARGYRRAGAVDGDELTQAGVVGLLRALERYEPARGVPFWAYATWWVRQGIQQVVSELSRPMVLSDRALRHLARVKEAGRRFEQTQRRQPTSIELASIVGLPRWQVQSLARAERTARGLDEPINSERGDALSLADLIADVPADDAYERVSEQDLASAVPRLLSYLTGRERRVICSRFGLGQREQTLRDVAPALGVSAERVRQIERDALRKLYAAATG